ncbi:MAG: GMC family oxidoreductase N-terminal domain-containing protein, partial [Saprospiraceae bacterium]
MPTQSERRLAALAAICDTLLPAIARTDDPDGYWARCASDLDVPTRIIALMANAKTEDRLAFQQLLDLLASPLLGLSWLGPLRSADRLRPAQRGTLLRRWAASPVADLRNAFNSLRKLTCLLYYGDVAPDQASNANWKTIGYQPLNQFIRPDPSPLPTLNLLNNTTLRCDVLVIGSGAGGSVVAAQLAAAGQQVLVVEKGGYAPIQEFNQQEVPMLSRHFEAGGLLTSQNGSITVLAGSTLGGGTTINWAASLRTTDYILEEWAKRHGNPHFLEKSYQQGFDYIEQRNGIRSDFVHNPQNQALLDGAQQLGYRAENIPMNLRFPENLSPETAWQACGFSCYGDAFGIKQGAVQTFLGDAAQHGATLLPGT